MNLKTLAGSLMLLGLASHVLAQGSDQRITITGSSIKRIQAEGALPVQTITRAELDRTGIQSAEQLISSLSANGNGLDNLASNADVVSGQARGNNGATSANLRGQGSNATLILLNGRRVAAHGLNGGVVDLNQIPFAAVERVEILKDGASSTYGTDAVGGVINFILRTNYTGLQLNAKADVTQHKGGDIYTASMVGGLGNLDSDGYNVLATISVQDNKRLDGRQRDFVNTFQPDRGLSPDTRGTPFATLFAIASTPRTIMTRPGQTATGTGPLRNGVTLNGINTLDLPGGAGCASQPDMGPYNEGIWAAGAAAQYGCAYDTGKAAVIQQPVKNTAFVGRGAFKLGQHTLTGEVLLGKSESDKVFSENQISSGSGTATVQLPNGTFVPSPFRNLLYPATGAGYRRVFNQLVAAFPELSVNDGQPIAFRWRCMVCGPREIATETDTTRFLVGADGPLPFLSGWDYRTGVSRATSKSDSTLGGGYHYQQGFANLINNGTLNPFLLDGESQTPQAVAALDAVSARGVRLYGGKFTMDEVDFTVTGPVYKLPAGEILGAVGVDWRSEKYKFDGNNSANTNDINTWIFNAPFDNINALAQKKRDVKAVFAELLFPITKSLELTLSGRHDQYDGFGSTNNPKVSARWAAADTLVLRGSYNTSFRVPTFNQLYNGITISPNTGAGVVDPEKCPSGVVNSTPNTPCSAITFETAFGGKDDLGPEKAKMANIGVVWQPVDSFSASLDWWTIRREGTIQTLSTSTFFANYNLFRDRFYRDANGNLVGVDIRYINAGETRTQGLELSLKGTVPFMGARITAGLDGTYLLEKKSRLLVSTPFSPSEIGLFKRSDDLGLRWKHTAYATYQRGDWTSTLTQVYSTGYAGYIPPGVASSAVKPAAWDPLVRPYVLHHLTVSYSGFKNLTLSAGVKNLLDRDPPFANSYDTNTGSGSSWEPRVADPRGRSYLVGAQYTFF